MIVDFTGTRVLEYYGAVKVELKRLRQAKREADRHSLLLDRMTSETFKELKKLRCRALPSQTTSFIGAQTETVELVVSQVAAVVLDLVSSLKKI